MFTYLTAKERTVIIGECYSATELTKLKTTAKELVLLTNDTVYEVWGRYHPSSKAPWLVNYLDDICAEALDLPNSYEVAQYLYAAVAVPEDFTDILAEGEDVAIKAGIGCIAHEQFVARKHEPYWYWVNFDGQQSAAVVNTTPILMREALDYTLTTTGAEVVIGWHAGDGMLVTCQIRCDESYLPRIRELTKFFDGNATDGWHVCKDSDTFKILLGLNAA